MILANHIHGGRGITNDAHSLKRGGAPINSNHKESGGNLVKDIMKQLVRKEDHNSHDHDHRMEEVVVVDAFYKDLVNLVNQQREKLSSQQIDLTKVRINVCFDVLRIT